MYGIKILLASVLVVFAQGSNFSQFPNWRSSWVMGGRETAHGDFMHMVSLKNSGNFEHFCGGSLMNYWYILTAAHCVHGRTTSSIIVVSGRRGQRTQPLGVSQIITHPDYHPSTYSNDIALIKVDKRVIYNQFRRTAIIHESDVQPGTVCVFAGWGKTSPAAVSYPNVLQQVQLKTISKTECLSVYPHLAENYFCAVAGRGKGLCMGDGGGSLMCGKRLVGVYSGGGRPGAVCSTPYPSVFVDVVNYSSWISIQINSP